MPEETTDLRERLSAGRHWLVDSIEQPPLTQIAARAATLRRRRHVGQMSGSLAVVLAVALLAVQPWHSGGGTPPPGSRPAATTAAPAPTWRGLGITLTGLSGTPLELPGDVVDVEFSDPDRGYLLTTDCQGGGDCRLGFARTADGGHSWQQAAPPVAAVPGDLAARRPRLWAVGNWVVFVGADGADGGTYASDDAGAHWTVRDPAAASATHLLEWLPPRARLWTGTAGGEVLAWLPDGAEGVALRHQPLITVRWVAETEAGDGGWWVGGIDPAGRPALAVTRDGARTWQPPATFTDPDAYEVRVATLGRDVYAAVLGPPGTGGTPERAIRAIYHSPDNGLHFERTRQAGVPAAMTGDLVPLLDGRLLLAGSDFSWYVSLDNGATFTGVPNLLSVRRIARTQSGYVAYNLLGGGWCAYSVDGSNWYKLNVK